MRAFERWNGRLAPLWPLFTEAVTLARGIGHVRSLFLDTQELQSLRELDKYNHRSREDSVAPLTYGFLHRVNKALQDQVKRTDSARLSVLADERWSPRPQLLKHMSVDR